MFGYLTVLNQLVSLKVLKADDIQMKSHFFNLIFELYNAMGDKISMQYGGSAAHHAQMGKKKGLGGGIGEGWTALVRHLNNNYSDPGR